MEGFYTPDLAMANIGVGSVLKVVDKQYDPQKDLMYWEFEVIYDYEED